MSTLRNQVIQSLNGLSDDSLCFLLDMIQRFVKPTDKAKETVSSNDNLRKIGLFKPEELYAPDYDFDEDNEEIAKMFGVMDE